jgi:5-formyltetrahydrofolate cyclo-ligase
MLYVISRAALPPRSRCAMFTCMDDIAAKKKDMRKAQRARRAKAHARHGGSAGEALARHGIGLCNPVPGGFVSSFLAIGEEIDTMPLMRRLWREQQSICLPVMVGKDKPLKFRMWREGDPLDEVSWGIREPRASALEVPPDTMLVPLLAFDARGYRLGYGGGYYDRSIAELRSQFTLVTIGLAYDELEVDAVPHSQYDEPLDWVLTPSGPRKCLPG